MGHAYLFSGPDGVGKTLLARETAKAVLCRSDKPRPCDACADCRMVAHDRHPDLMLGQAEEEKRAILIGQVREMTRYLSLKPVQAERRVVILREADLIREDAANTMLKTLEEPPPFGMLILTSARPRMLLSTIRSRCQEVPFAPLKSSVIERILTRHPQRDREAIRVAARLADGSAGKALEILESDCLDMYQRTLEGTLALPQGDPFALTDNLLDWAKASARSKTLEPQRERVREILRLLSCAYRDLLVIAVGGAESDLYHHDIARLRALGGRLPPGRVLRLLDAVWDARRQTDANASMGLVLDGLFGRVAELQN